MVTAIIIAAVALVTIVVIWALVASYAVKRVSRMQDRILDEFERPRRLL